jgi:hypothetical protein
MPRTRRALRERNHLSKFDRLLLRWVESPLMRENHLFLTTCFSGHDFYVLFFIRCWTFDVRRSSFD